ncbi:DUF1207 domain-containing protein [Spirosoma sp. HMF4905]|uniref:DUF1207 domain-containing protein n=1 Tax=Spirosoma arboris TaxID=2682092 RepID=A0A7K1SA74_9BACT|nr:DUF1207 domain-containing protein [Spirosoma arboris]MVM30671.1 DUF1207 domain-containing protein [Spirosoma arboris]
MKKTFSVLLLSFFMVTWASAQQTPTTPPARVLTPAEQKQKDRIDREVQRERQIRAEWLQKQREYEAKQAEKERQRQAKKAGKELPPKEVPQAKPTVVAPAATVPEAQPQSPVSQPVATTPAIVDPTEKEKRSNEEKAAKEAKKAQQKADKQAAREAKEAQQKAEKQAAREAKEAQQKAAKASQVQPSPITEKPVVVPTPTEPTVKTEKPQRPKREKKPIVEGTDSTALLSGNSAEPTVARAGREFLPKGHLFDPIILDPLEAQTYGSILPGYWTEGQKYKGSIVPFAFGFAKPFYRRTTEPGRAEEWVLDLASFTQFEAYHDDVMNKARRQIVNTDYKISIIYNIRRGEHNYRIRVYHISSHLGDDYIYRNKLTAPSPNSVNYEQLDFTYSRTVNNWRLYGGAGIVLRKTEERKLLSAQLGAFYKKPSTKAARLVGGADIKFWQQTDFRPGIHGGIGIELGRTQNNLTFLLEGYSGFRPYSQYEQQQTSWIGVGLYLNPF